MANRIIVHAEDRWSGQATTWRHETVDALELARALARWQETVGQIVEHGQLKVTHVTVEEIK